MRIWLSLSLMLFFLVGSSQDTLYYKNGEMRIGHLLSIDSVGQRLALKNTSNMIQVIQFNVIQRIGQDQVALIQPDYFKASQIFEAPQISRDQYLKDTIPSPVYYFFHRKSPFELGKFMISINPISPFVKEKQPFPFNPSFMVGFEYLLNDKLGVSIFYRGGFGFLDIPSDTTPEYNPIPIYIDEFNELGYQIGISPKWYVLGQTKHALFLSPYFSFGKYFYYQVNEMLRYEISSETGWRELTGTDYVVRRYESGLIEGGFTTGLTLNFTEHLAGTVQVLGFWTKNQRRDHIYSEYVRDELDFNLRFKSDPLQFQHRIQLLLVYRI